MSIRKRFNKELYTLYDLKAKKWFDRLLPERYTCVENTKKTDVDLLVYRGNERIFNAEVEVKIIWKDEDFPFDTIHLPKRKLKYCLLDKPTLFVVFNKLGNRYCCFWSHKVHKAPLKEVPNKFVSRGEFFFDINKKEFDFDINKALKRKWVFAHRRTKDERDNRTSESD